MSRPAAPPGLNLRSPRNSRDPYLGLSSHLHLHATINSFPDAVSCGQSLEYLSARVNHYSASLNRSNYVVFWLLLLLLSSRQALVLLCPTASIVQSTSRHDSSRAFHCSACTEYRVLLAVAPPAQLPSRPPHSRIGLPEPDPSLPQQLICAVKGHPCYRCLPQLM